VGRENRSAGLEAESLSPLAPSASLYVAGPNARQEIMRKPSPNDSNQFLHSTRVEFVE